MSKNISKIELFKYNNIATLKQNVINKQYLLLDLWETLSNNNYQQIFLQLNNVRVINITNDKIYFDITNRNDIIQSMINIENKIIYILKNYLARINKHGKFNFKSIIKENTTDNKTLLELNLNNNDYPINIYNNAKQKTDLSIFNTNATFNIILELMYIRFDMCKGMIIIDTCFRLAVENTILPRRIQITNVNSFLVNDNTNNEKEVFNITHDVSDNDDNEVSDNDDNEVFNITHGVSDNENKDDDAELFSKSSNEHSLNNTLHDINNNNIVDSITSSESNNSDNKKIDNNIVDSNTSFEINDFNNKEIDNNIVDSNTSSEINDSNNKEIDNNKIRLSSDTSSEINDSDNKEIDNNIIRLSSDTDNNTDDIITSLKQKLN